jgi:parallel beta-helix repeat protein
MRHRHGARAMRCSRLLKWALGIAFAAIPWAVPDPAVGDCRSGETCHCGDVVRGAVTLTTDLTGCGSRGLSLARDASLDCAGHTIHGGETFSDIGLRLDRSTGVEVRNCRITGFRRGIRLRGGTGNVIIGSELTGNEYGLEVAGNTNAGPAVGHRIEGNVVHGNFLDGIHVGRGSRGIVIVGNEIRDNGQENLFFLDSEQCVVDGNRVSGGRAAGIYIKDSARNFFLANRVADRPVQVRGHSVDNVFAENVVHEAAMVFEALAGGYPARNVVVGGAVRESMFCFRFAGALDQYVSGVLAHRCTPASFEARDGQAATGNVVDVVPVTDDFDGDGTANAIDACTDVDGDGLGDPGFSHNVCPVDNCRLIANAQQEDTDDDGSGDVCDLCPVEFDPGWQDRDGDGLGDVCNECIDAVDGALCDDANACTMNDACRARQCTGALVNCGDGNVCTDDTCDRKAGCAHVPNHAACDDGNPCTQGEVCDGGTCGEGEPVSCPAPDQCHVGVCDPETGACNPSPVADGVPCDDGNACTLGDACDAGTCVGPEPLVCNDDDECTADGCQPASGCAHEPPGFVSTAAAFAPALSAECTGARLPRRARRLFGRAAHLIERASQAPTAAKAARKLGKVSRLLGKAARAIQHLDETDVSSGCRAGALGRIGEANLRTLCLAASLAL